MLRHGETADNVSKRYSRDNTSLTDKGKKEILASKKLLAQLNYKDVYYSPLTRTKESLEVLGIDGIEDGRIREIDFGLFKGLNFEEISNQYPRETEQWIADPFHYKFPEGESALEVYSRINDFLEELIRNDRNTLLICHDGVIRLILSWVFADPTYAFRFKVDNGSLSIITIENDYTFIKKMNVQ